MKEDTLRFSETEVRYAINEAMDNWWPWYWFLLPTGVSPRFRMQEKVVRFLNALEADRLRLNK